MDTDNNYIEEKDNALFINDKGKQRIKNLIRNHKQNISISNTQKERLLSFFYGISLLTFFIGLWFGMKFLLFIQNQIIWPLENVSFIVFNQPVYWQEIPFFIIGLLLFVKGGIMVIRTNYYLKHCKSENKYLITNGPFSGRIHPMYGGWIIAWISLGLVSGVPIIFLLTILMAIGQMISANYFGFKLSNL